MRMEKTFILGLIMILIGITIIVFTSFIAYTAYMNYRPFIPFTNDLSQAITNASFELINLAAKIAFLGVMLWGSSILLKNGINLIKTEKVREEKQE